MSADYSDRAGLLHGLEAEYTNKYQRTGAMADLKTVIQSYEEALDHSSSSIDSR